MRLSSMWAYCAHCTRLSTLATLLVALPLGIGATKTTADYFVEWDFVNWSSDAVSQFNSRTGSGKDFASITANQVWVFRDKDKEYSNLAVDDLEGLAFCGPDNDNRRVRFYVAPDDANQKGIYLYNTRNISGESYILVPISANQRLTVWGTGGDSGKDAAISFALLDGSRNQLSTTGTSRFSSYGAEPAEIFVDATADGYVKIKTEGGNNALIKKIMVEKPYVNFVSKEATIDLITLSNASMPGVEYYPHNAELTFKSSNTKLALIRDPHVYDVMCIAPGITSIECSTKVGNQTLSDRLTLRIEADSADYELSEPVGVTGYEHYSRYTLTGAGVMKTRAVKNIEGVTVNFGPAELVNTTIVRNETMADGKQHFVATTIAFNDGWRDCQFNADGIPTQGTFYHVVPQVTGEFTFTGYPAGNNRVVLLQVDKAGNKQRVAGATVEAGNDKKKVTKTVMLSPEYEYYLFGINASPNCPTEEGDVEPNGVDNSHWCTFQLESFSYVTKFYLSQPSYTVSGDPSKKGSAKNVATLEGYNPAHDYTIEKLYTLGTISDFDFALDGDELSFNSISYTTSDGNLQGGAAVVRISHPADGQVEFVLTVPYGLHQWNFFNGDDEHTATLHTTGKDDVTYANLRKDKGEGGIDVLGKSWGINYEVREWTNRVLSECKDPVLGVLSPVNGNNAAYIPATAGLVFRAGSLGFGTRIDQWTDDTGETSALDNAAFNQRYSYNERYYMSADRVKEVSYVKFGSYRQESTLVIPQVKKNRYVRIFWKQHSGTGGSSGATFAARNLADIDGKPIDENFAISGVVFNNNSPYYHGCVIFRATGDNDYNDAELTIKDGGYNYLVRVDITDDYETDLRLFDRASSRIMEDYVRSDGHLSHKQGTTATLKTDGSQNWSEAAREARYRVVATDGLTEGEDFKIEDSRWDSEGGGHYNDCLITAIKGNGAFLLQQDITYGEGGKYVLNRMEQWIPVGEYTVKNYPYTWDFTAYNMDAADEAERATTKMDATQGNNTNGTWNDSYQMQHWTNVAATTVKRWNGTEWTGQTLYADAAGKQALVMFEKPLFANGGELTANHQPIRETQGLSINLGTDGRSSTGAIRDRVNRRLTLDGTAMTIDKAGSGSTPKVTIPEVPAGMFVFVKCSAAPSEVTGATAVEKYDGHVNDFDLQGDVYVYKVTAMSDVALSFANKSAVEKIGVTDQFKQIVNTAGKTTESRAIAIDYSQTNHFLNPTLTAYMATAYKDNDDGQTGSMTLKAIDIVPAETGLLLYTSATTGNVSNPLFVPACNNTVESTEGNRLVANVNSGTVAGSTDTEYRYVFTNQFRVRGQSNWRQGDYGFYKVNSNGTLKGNMAYLQLEKEGDEVGYAREIVLLDTDETTAITSINNERLTMHNPTAVYDLQGRKIADNYELCIMNYALPAGIYIVGGKKVVVK